MQRRIVGRGVGGIFRGIIKFFKPLFNFLVPTISKAANSKVGRKLIKQAKKSVVKAGFSSAADIIKGENVGSTMSKHLKKASADILKKVGDSGSVSKKKSKKTSKKKLYNFFH